ncbi:MAG: NAD(P)H-binding protein [Solirubrobacteraceae bacterium]
MSSSDAPILLTGASGYVGGQLLPRLAGRGPVRVLARSPEKLDLPGEVEAVKGDAVSGAGLAEALEGIGTAYYLIHSMGRGSDSADFAERDRRAAEQFGRAAGEAGVERIVYLGGLAPSGTEAAQSHHLRSREEVGEILAGHVPGTVHVRAAMVIGAGSASFVMLRGLVTRLPAMICPRWIDTRSQPVAVDDVVGTLAALADHPDPPAEVQLGGADVLTYRQMMQRFARVMGRREPVIVKVPVLTPQLSSYWVMLVTPVEAGLVRPLVDGLSAEMVVTAPPPSGLNDAPLGFEDAARAALEAA